MICSLIASAIIALVLIQRSRKLNRNTIALSAGIFIGLPVAVYYIATLQVDVAALSPVAGMMDISSRPDKWLWIIDFVIFLGLLVALLRSRYSRP